MSNRRHSNPHILSKNTFIFLAMSQKRLVQDVRERKSSGSYMDCRISVHKFLYKTLICNRSDVYVAVVVVELSFN